jgi:hypothetical protein
MSQWKPIGRFVLVRLRKAGSVIDIQGEGKYNGLAEVLAIGPDVAEVAVGDTVLLNGPQGVISHREFGEDDALVAAPLLLAKWQEKQVMQ